MTVTFNIVNVMCVVILGNIIIFSIFLIKLLLPLFEGSTYFVLIFYYHHSRETVDIFNEKSLKNKHDLNKET